MSLSLPLCDLKWTQSARKIFDRHFWCLSCLLSVLHSKTGGFKDLLLRKNIDIVASHELTKNDCIQKHTLNWNFIIINTFYQTDARLAMMLFRKKLPHIISCKELKAYQKKQAKKLRSKNCSWLFRYLLRAKENWCLLFQFFCMRCNNW